MAKHRLDHEQPLFPDPMGTATDITDETERYAHFEREAVAAKDALRKVRNLKLTETDWTRPAESPPLTFRHKTGESSYPTILSNTRLACWASTKS